jgi:hypothetical protein
MCIKLVVNLNSTTLAVAYLYTALKLLFQTWHSEGLVVSFCTKSQCSKWTRTKGNVCQLIQKIKSFVVH